MSDFLDSSHGCEAVAEIIVQDWKRTQCRTIKTKRFLLMLCVLNVLCYVFTLLRELPSAAFEGGPTQTPRRAQRAAHKILKHQAVREAFCYVQSPTAKLRVPLFRILKGGCRSTFSNEPEAPQRWAYLRQLHRHGRREHKKTRENQRCCRCTAMHPKFDLRRRPERGTTRNPPEPHGTPLKRPRNPLGAPRNPRGTPSGTS